MNCLKNPHYKSTAQFYDNSIQLILASNVANTPKILNLGTQVTDTGVAIDFTQQGITLNSTGTYEISVDAVLSGTVAGDITLAIADNGVILPETVKTLAVTTTSVETIPLETVRYFPASCATSNNITIVAYSDGTATGSVTLSGNVIKLA